MHILHTHAHTLSHTFVIYIGYICKDVYGFGGICKIKFVFIKCLNSVRMYIKCLTYFY